MNSLIFIWREVFFFFLKVWEKHAALCSSLLVYIKKKKPKDRTKYLENDALATRWQLIKIMPHFLAFQQSKQLKWKRKNNYWCFRKYVGFFFFSSWVNIKSHLKLWSECFWAFQTSRKLATFHSTCQLPQSVWTGNLLLRLSYLLLSYCQGCLGNENRCEVSLLLFFLSLSLPLSLPGTAHWMQINKNMKEWRKLLCGIRSV